MKNSKAQSWFNLKCLCLIAATMAFTLGLLIAPFLKLSSRAMASEEPSRQLMRQYHLMWPKPTNNQIVEEVEPSTAAINQTLDSEDIQEEEALSNTETHLQLETEGNKTLYNDTAHLQEDIEDKKPVYSNTSSLQLPSESAKTCDIFKGKWVHDNSEPLYRNETCPFLSQTQNCPGNGRKDTGYLNWRWKPRECELPRFDAVAFLGMMRGKTLGFIGDSVSRNHFESLMCTLWQVAQPSPRGNRKYQRWVFRDYDVKIVRIWSSWLVRHSSEAIDFAPENMTKLHLNELDEQIAEHLPMFDVVLVASGHWWPKTTAYIVDGKVVGGNGWWNKNYKKHHDVLSGYGVAMKTALKAIVSHPGYKGLTILRTFSPEHYEGGAWNTGGSCTGKTKPLTKKELAVNTYQNTLYSHQMAAVIEAKRIGQANSNKLSVMDVTRPFSYRADGHPGPYRNNDPNKRTVRGPDGQPPPQDCLHWCMPGPIDTWNEYLFDMLKREFRTENS